MDTRSARIGRMRKVSKLDVDEKTIAVLDRKNYEIQKKVSEGAFGQVYKGFNYVTNDPVAVKVMDLTKVGAKFKKEFLPRELAALIGIKHEYTITIHDIIKCANKIFIFMEWANGGDLTGFLTKNNGPANEEKASYWYNQISLALNYLHLELRMCHRDIKLDNVLLNNGQCKLTDFGFAKMSWDTENDCPVMSETFCGTEPYYSPQIVERKRYNPFLADSWAMGVMLFCLTNNKYPFHFGPGEDMLGEQKNPCYISLRFVKRFSGELRDLCKRHFEYQESKRILMADALKHPFIKLGKNCR